MFGALTSEEAAALYVRLFRAWDRLEIFTEIENEFAELLDDAWERIAEPQRIRLRAEL